MTGEQQDVAALVASRVVALAAGRSLDPTEIARAIAGPDEKRWRLLMPAIRMAAIRLAEAGGATILRKGKIADPRAFKGIYRIGRPPAEGETR